MPRYPQAADPAPRENLSSIVQFAYNPEPRCACVLLLDTSDSMRGKPIRALNEGIRQYVDDLIMDPVASLRVETAIVTFDDETNIVLDFATSVDIGDVTLTTGGLTNMAPAINQALDMLHARKLQYRNAGIDYYRPWVILITDGEPTDDVDDLLAASERLKREEAAKSVAFFCLGVQNANMEILNALGSRPALPLKGLAFTQFFNWLSTSMQAVSASQIDDEIRLPDRSGWEMV